MNYLAKYQRFSIGSLRKTADWLYCYAAEHLIHAVIDRIECDYSFIAGDFNCSSNSSVHRYLLGQQSLHNEESNPYWYDLAESYGNIKGIEPDVTLDFRTNPRWNGKDTIEINQRCDCIFIRNPYPKDFSCLVYCNTFGKEIDFHTNLTASDHWGVFCDLDFI